MQGKLITFEGGDGAGKSTQIRLVGDLLRQLGCEVVVTREPGGCDLAEKIRALLVTGEPGGMAPATELLLMEAARAEHVAQVIRPALEQGAWVLCDRFFDSTTAYQGYGRGMDLTWIDTLNRWATGDLIPDRTFYLDLDPEAGVSRSQGGEESRFEREGGAFHRRVREGFLNLAGRFPQRLRLIDATRDPDGVFQQIRQGMGDLLEAT
ncbi:MAG: dTMP kinase [Magnetococcales bacterium]|nr:dTMP kinase [Magnetococcales bacterium]